jgi:hypothetical protein
MHRARSFAVAAVAVLGLAVPAVAHADLPLTVGQAAPADGQAGGHSDFTLNLAFGGSDNVQNLAIHLPAGLIGNPSAATPCPIADFEQGNDAGTAADCPDASVVGTTTVQATATLLVLPLPITAVGKVYVLAPKDGETARLGIEVTPTDVGGVPGQGALLGQHIRLESPVSLRTTGDGGLDSTISGVPTTAAGLPVRINTMSLTLNAHANGHDFLTNPTSCGTNTTTVDATSYESPGTSHGAATFTTTGCASVPFAPTLHVTPTTTKASSNAGYTVDLQLPAGEDPIRQSHVRRTDVTLPVGVALNPGLAATVQACTDAQFGAGSNAPATCPAGSQVGTVALDTPVLGTVNGKVFLGQSNAQHLLRLFVLVESPERGVRVKLTGSNDLDPTTGQVTAVFDGLPPIPFTSFRLTFAGGDHSVLTTPSTCGPAESTARLVPYSGQPDVTVHDSFTVSADGAGGACPAKRPFAPTISASVAPTQAAAGTTTAITLARHDADELLKDVVVRMPPGLAGSLKGIPFCPDAAANAGTCPANTRVGHVHAEAGIGAAPLSIDGNVYLAGPGDGALARLAIVLPGKVGPFDFGNVVSFAGLGIRTTDAGLNVTTRNLPTSLQGIPLNLRLLRLTLDRPGFARNATSCAPKQIAADFTSTTGAKATATTPYQATGCDREAYKPAVSVRLSGDLSDGGRPAATVAVTQPDGQAASRRVQVVLPGTIDNGINTSKSTLCDGAHLAAHTCPASSIIGTATAQTPLLPIPLTGSVYLGYDPKINALPILRITLAPLGITLTGNTGFVGTGISNTFDNLPDTPLTNFQLSLKGGPAGILIALHDFCRTSPGLASGTFLAQNGATARASARATVTGCSAKPGKPKVTATFRALGKKRTGLTVTAKQGSKAPKLSRVKVTLPTGVKVKSIAKRLAKAAPKGSKLKRTSRTVEVRAPKAGAKTLTLTLKTGALTSSRRKPKTRLTVVVTDAKGHRTTLHVTAKRKR